MTKTEIINETVAFYSEDVSRRSFTADGCWNILTSEDGITRKCAVGRCMNEESISNPANRKSSVGVFKQNDSIDHILNPEYQGHSADFWAELQVVHDSTGHWDAQGLTPRGIEWINDLLNKYPDQITT